MKVCYLSPTGSIGGAEMVLLDLLATLRAARPGWDLAAILGSDGPLRGEAAALGVRCEVLPLPPAVARLGDFALSGPVGAAALARRAAAAAAPAAAFAARLARALRREGPDLVHTNGMKAHVLGAWASPRASSVLWHLHDFAGSRPVMARLLRASSRRGVRVAAVSRAVAADASETLGPGVPVATIRNGVDLLRFAPEGPSADLDAASGLPPAPPGTVRVGLVATFARWKGHDVFLDAAARVPEAPSCRFYVVGGPIYATPGSQWEPSELRLRAARLGLGGRVGFAGWIEPSEALRALDVVVHASTRPEPFGRVIAEAMACGRAVIAARAGGAAELFEDGSEAVGVEPGDAGALAGAMARLVADEPLRRLLGGAAHRSARSRLDREDRAEAWATCYEEAVAAGGLRGSGVLRP